MVWEVYHFCCEIYIRTPEYTHFEIQALTPGDIQLEIKLIGKDINLTFFITNPTLSSFLLPT